MLINILLDQFLNIKVSQGSVVTRLRCDGIYNDHYTITAESKTENVENRTTYAEVIGN